MTVQQLVAWYELGAVTEHELVVRCLDLVDPRDPAAVLDGLPARTLPWLRDFLDHYRPGEMLSLRGGTIPTPDQVLAAKGWLSGRTPSGRVIQPAPISPSAAPAAT
jgi:hypothetical protein